ncbi:MAG: hypothetical protein K6B40_03555 [Firmicutes bacterium]|nr:hypothetical protein [Bacillota bacterium]
MQNDRANEENSAPLSEEQYRDDLLRTLGENAAAIIHELKSPLAGIQAQLQLLEKRLSLGGRSEDVLLQERFDLIFSEIQRMSQLINEFLLLSTPRAPKWQQVEMVDLINQTVNLLQSLCLSKGVALEWQAPAGPRLLFGDEQKLKQVLVNLIVNAQQACGCGGKIRIALQDGPDALILSVADSGVGMDEQQLQQIFDPFYTTKAKGSGLGLTILRQIVESHHGQIEVFSRPDQGSRFQITFPTLFAFPQKRQANGASAGRKTAFR